MPCNIIKHNAWKGLGLLPAPKSLWLLLYLYALRINEI